MMQHMNPVDIRHPSGKQWGSSEKTSWKFADKPGSVEHPQRGCGCRAIIPLGAMLPWRSSSLPGSDASHAITPLFGLAPDGVYHASPVASPAVGSYPPALSPRPVPHLRTTPHRFTLTCANKWPSAVCSLLHFPSPCGARPLAGILLCGARTFLHAPRCAAIAWRTSSVDYTREINRPRG